MNTSTKSGDRRMPLVCTTCARLALQWRAAAERESGEVARTEQNLRYASLEEFGSFVAASTQVRVETEAAIQQLRTHRATHEQ